MRFWPFRRKTAEVAAVAQPVTVGETVREERLIGRLTNLFDWLEQKGRTASPEKRAEIEGELNRYRFALAAKGYPLVQTKRDLEDIVNGRRHP